MSVRKFFLDEIFSLIERKIFLQVIVRQAGKIILYCKGADSKIKERLDPSEKTIMTQTDEHLNVIDRS